MLDNIFKINSYIFAYLNTFYLTLFFKQVGRGSLIFPHSRILSPSRISVGRKCMILPGSRMEVVKTGDAHLTIGDNCHVGNNLFISCAANITIGDGVLLSDNVCIVDNTHINVDTTRSTIGQGISSECINVCDNVTIFRNATILEGVTIGEGAVIGAGALVNKDVRPYAIVSGSPAREIGTRS
jgi:acetyltransferase-like isoleucine patch superfamily enzyme